MSPGKRILLARMYSIGIAGATSWLALGILLRITGTRDRFDWLAVVYYTTPWAVVVLGFAGLAILTNWRRNSIGAVLYCVLSVTAGIAWCASSWQSTPPDAAETDVDCRLVHWNVRNNQRDLDSLAEKIRAFDPDIVALAEAGNHRSNVDPWSSAFPTYSLLRQPRQMLAMSRTKLIRKERGALDDSSAFAIATTHARDHEVTIIQADITAQPLRSRRKALEALTAHVRRHSANPLILLGDFNTPHQSYHFDSIRGMLRHAFETRGAGLADTWPLPVPVLTLDQVWVSEHFEVVSCTQGWSMKSDHRPVFVELRLRDRPVTKQNAPVREDAMKGVKY